MIKKKLLKYSIVLGVIKKVALLLFFVFMGCDDTPAGEQRTKTVGMGQWDKQ